MRRQLLLSHTCIIVTLKNHPSVCKLARTACSFISLMTPPAAGATRCHGPFRSSSSVCTCSIFPLRYCMLACALPPPRRLNSCSMGGGWAHVATTLLRGTWHATWQPVCSRKHLSTDNSSFQTLPRTHSRLLAYLNKVAQGDPNAPGRAANLLAWHFQANRAHSQQLNPANASRLGRKPTTTRGSGTLAAQNKAGWTAYGLAAARGSRCACTSSAAANIQPHFCNSKLACARLPLGAAACAPVSVSGRSQSSSGPPAARLPGTLRRGCRHTACTGRLGMSGGQLNSKAGDYLPLTAHSQSRRCWRSSALPPQDATPSQTGRT